MTLLGHKLMKAEIVTKEDAARVHRQEIIAREQKRKAIERHKTKRQQQAQRRSNDESR